jgi:hypothetical protein
MFKKAFNWLVWIFATWGLIVVLIFAYQSSIMKPASEGPYLYESPGTDFKRNQKIVLVELEKNYSYLQTESFLKKWFNIPLAAIKYDWHATYQFGIEFSHDWLWSPKYEENVVMIQAPKIKLLDLNISDKNSPNVLNSSVFLNSADMEKEMLAKRDAILWSEGEKWLEDSELKDSSHKALGEVFLNFLKQLNLKEEVAEVKVEVKD